MKTRLRRFNTYLLLPLCLALATGCASSDGDGKNGKTQPVKLRLHLESKQDVPEHLITATLGRSNPFSLSVEKSPFLQEDKVEQATLLESMGLYSISVLFDQQGLRLLDQYSTANKGRRIAIWAEFGEARWVGASTITRRIDSATFTFTPDTTREEAQKIVDGLNLVAAQIKGRRR